MATVFWDTAGFIHMDFLEHGTTFNSQPLQCNTGNSETTLKKS
jgi:Transposase.